MPKLGSGVKSGCEHPVEASLNTCKMQEATTLGAACGLQLAEDCAEAGMRFLMNGECVGVLVLSHTEYCGCY